MLQLVFEPPIGKIFKKKTYQVHGHLLQFLEYKKKMTFPLVLVLFRNFPFKNIHIFVVLGCPEQRIKELSDVRLVIQAMSHLVAMG